MTVVCLFAALALTVQTYAKITTFNVKGAGTGADQGTIALGINVRGSIVGYYVDSSGVDHGFLRAPNGTITTFDPKGSAGTIAYGLNKEGAITGFYFDSSSNMYHGFLRAPNGTFTAFDPKGSAGTFAGNINDTGAIAGYYVDFSGGITVSCAFSRSITTFGPAGSTDTFTAFFTGLNNFRKVAGDYLDLVACTTASCASSNKPLPCF